MAKHHREDAAGRGAMAELLLARELQRSSIGKMLLAGALWRKQLARAAGENSRRKQPAAAANRQWPFDKANAKCQFGKSSTRCHFGRVGPVVILTEALRGEIGKRERNK